VSAGQKIPADGIRQIMVPEDTELQYVPWTQRNSLTGKYRASTDIVKGSLLIGPMLTEGDAIDAGKVLVGLTLKPGQYPVGLTSGNHVAAYPVDANASGTPTDGKGGQGSSSLGSQPIVSDAKVQTADLSKDGALGSGGMSVTLLVNADEAGALASAAASQKVALAQVRGGNG
jgi:hypothetical protein